MLNFNKLFEGINDSIKKIDGIQKVEEIKLNKFNENFTDKILNEDTNNYNYNISNLDDISSNLIGNCSDEEIDSSIKVFDKICKLLNVDNYSNVWIITTDSEYDIKEYKKDLGSELINEFPKLSLELYSFNNNFVVREKINLKINLYFNDEDLAQKYINTIDEINK